MQTRVYLPLTRKALLALHTGGELPAVPLAAFAVTARLRRDHSGADEEELEYLAFLDATQAASGSPAVVAAADVESEAVDDRDSASGVSPHDTPGPASSRVAVLAPVTMRRVVSFHVQEPVTATNSGGSPDFLWYDVTEIDALVDLLG